MENKKAFIEAAKALYLSNLSPYANGLTRFKVLRCRTLIEYSLQLLELTKAGYEMAKDYAGAYQISLNAVGFTIVLIKPERVQSIDLSLIEKQAAAAYVAEAKKQKADDVRELRELEKELATVREAAAELEKKMGDRV